MNWSIKLGTIKDIEIKVHLTFLLVILWAAIEGGLVTGEGLRGALFGVLFISILFVCVVLHELGHSLQAMKYGVKVKNITLLPIGGVAQMDSIPEKPGRELSIALAGPTVNFVIAGILGLILLFVRQTGLVVDWNDLLYQPLSVHWRKLLFSLLVANLALGCFNLIPAFPMDGGRVLRSLLALRFDYVKATRIAVNVGRGLAVLLGLIGLMSGNFTLTFIGIFVFAGASQENKIARLRNVLRELRVSQALSEGIRTISPHTSLAYVLTLTLRGRQADFPVVENGRLVGILPRDDLLTALKEHGGKALVRQVMRTEFPIASLADTLFRVQQMIVQSGVKAIPVIEGGLFRGLITLDDINRAYVSVSVSPPTAPH